MGLCQTATVSFAITLLGVAWIGGGLGHLVLVRDVPGDGRLLIFTILFTAAITLSLSWVVWRLSLKYKLYPGIRERDVHKTPTPRLGGVAMFLGVVAAFAVSSQQRLFSMAPYARYGFFNRNYDVARDGTFLMLRLTGASTSRLVAVHGWAPSLRARTGR